MDFKEAVEMLKDNPEIAKSLEEALRRKAGAEELAAILEEASLDASAAEALAAEYQRRIGAAIAEEDVDEGTLTRVAGGSHENCDDILFHNTCDNNTCNYVPSDPNFCFDPSSNGDCPLEMI